MSTSSDLYVMTQRRCDCPEDSYCACMHDTEDGPGRALATLLKDARIRLGWSQEDLESASGVSRQTISRYESGKASNPRAEEARAVARALQIDPRELPVALGYVTREEMGLPPAPPAMDPTLAAAARLLASEDIAVGAKDNLRRLLEGAVSFTYEALGLRRPAAPGATDGGRPARRSPRR